MATAAELYAVTGVIPVKRATVLIGKTATAAVPKIEGINLDDLSTMPEDWEPVALTSKQTLPSLSVDGGEAQTIDSAEYESIISFNSTKKDTLSFTTIGLTKECVQLAYGSSASQWDEDTKGVDESQNYEGVDKPVMFLFYGAGRVMGRYFANVKIVKGEDQTPESDGTTPAGMVFNGTIQAPTGDQRNAKLPRHRFLIPRPVTFA